MANGLSAPHCWIPPWQVALRRRAFRARGSGCEVNRHPNCWVISWDFMEFNRNARAHFLGCNEINDGDIMFINDKLNYAMQWIGGS